MITTFLETCMKLIHDSKPMQGLLELFNWSAHKDDATGEPHIVKKFGMHKARTGREMRLTVQIGEYEIDQVILDLGSICESFAKENMGKNGETCALVVSYPIKDGE